MSCVQRNWDGLGHVQGSRTCICTCTVGHEVILGDEIKVINGVTAVQKAKKTFGFVKEEGRKMHITGNGSALQLNENVMCPHMYIIVNKYDNK